MASNLLPLLLFYWLRSYTNRYSSVEIYPGSFRIPEIDIHRGGHQYLSSMDCLYQVCKRVGCYDDVVQGLACLSSNRPFRIQ